MLTRSQTPGLERVQGHVLVSRAFCRFETFKPPASLKPADAKKAVWLFAETQAPFAECQTLVMNRHTHFEVWSWDVAQMRALGATENELSDCAPETIFQKGADGWRQLRLAVGFEAQYWKDGVLIASSWRRNMFTDDQWRVFAVSVDEPQMLAPASAPYPEGVIRAVLKDWRRDIVEKDAEWRHLKSIALGIGAIALILSCYVGGQTVRLLFAQSSDMKSQAPAERVSRAKEYLAAMDQLRTQAPDSNPLLSLATAKKVARAFNAEPRSWGADEEQVELSFDPNGFGPSAEQLATALELSKEFKNVSPILRRDGGLTIKAEIERAR